MVADSGKSITCNWCGYSKALPTYTEGGEERVKITGINGWRFDTETGWTCGASCQFSERVRILSTAQPMTERSDTATAPQRSFP